MSPDELREFKLKTKCTLSGNNRHWVVETMNNFTIRDCIPCTLPRNNEQNGLRNGTKDFNRNAHCNNCNQLVENQSGGQHDNQNILNSTFSLICSTVTSNPAISTSPLVDDGAQFSSIGMTGLCLLRHVESTIAVTLAQKPPSLSSYMWWKFGTSTHSSASRQILGSMNLCEH